MGYLAFYIKFRYSIQRACLTAARRFGAAAIVVFLREIVNLNDLGNRNMHETYGWNGD